MFMLNGINVMPIVAYGIGIKYETNAEMRPRTGMLDVNPSGLK